MMMTLDQALAFLPGARLVGSGATAIERVHTDTRTLAAGDLFVALKGERFDANAFLAEAKAGGAVAAIAHGGLEAAGHPLGRRGVADLADGCGVPRAELSVLDGHGDLPGGVRWSCSLRSLIWKPKRRAVGRGDLAREAEHAEAVGPVRRDLEVQHGVAIGQRFKAFHRESADAHRGGHVGWRRGHVHHLAKPRVGDLHDGNCSRNRRSLS